MVYPYLIVRDTSVRGSFVTGIKALIDQFEIHPVINSGYPPPSVTVDLSSLDENEVLPSFLNERASDLGMKGYGSTNRIRQFRGVPFECRKAIQKKYAKWNLLSDEVVIHMLRLQTHDLERMEELWRAIEDGLFLSSPENFVQEHQEPIRRIFRWFVSNYVYNGHTATVSAYKTFQQLIKQKGSLSESKEVEPLYFPWYDASTKKLGKTGIFWLDEIISRGVRTKDECRRFMHFISLRGSPCPNRIKCITSLLEHQILRCSQPAPTDAVRLAELFTIGVRIGQRANKKALMRSVLKTEHVSVSNSSCYENSRSSGGRATYVQEQLEKWYNRIPTEDCQQRLILGDIIQVKAGIPYWKSFTPMGPLSEREMDPSMAYGQPYQGDLLPRYAGLNENSGYALLQWSFEEGVHCGVLDENLKVIGNARQIARCIGEPGDKARSLTIDQAWLTVYLTPLGHLLVDTMRTIPEVSAGLGFGQPCYHFVQRISEHLKRNPDQFNLFEFSWLLTSDLDRATDHFNRIKSRYLLKGYLRGLGRDFENNYCLSAVELLTSQRQCEWRI
jgi:hypothetical protein